MITRSDRFTRLWPIWAGALILALGIAGAAHAQGADAPEVTKPPPPPSSYIVRVNAGENTICTGFYVGNDRVVTAGHCVRNRLSDVYKVIADDGAEFPARVAGFGNVDLGMDDWAILAIRMTPGGWDPAPLDCSKKSPPIGTEVRTEGFPGPEMSEFRVVRGWIAGVTAMFFDWSHPVMHIQMPVIPGNSGGPVIRQSDGAVLGIVIAFNGAAPQFSLATPIGIVCDILHKSL